MCTFLSSRSRSEQLKGGCGYTGSWCTSLSDGTKMRWEPELVCKKKKHVRRGRKMNTARSRVTDSKCQGLRQEPASEGNAQNGALPRGGGAVPHGTLGVRDVCSIIRPPRGLRTCLLPAPCHVLLREEEDDQQKKGR